MQFFTTLKYWSIVLFEFKEKLSIEYALISTLNLHLALLMRIIKVAHCLLTLNDESRQVVINLKTIHGYNSILKYRKVGCYTGNVCCFLEVKEVSYHRYLGISINNCLNGKEHNHNTRKNLNTTRKLYLLRNVCSVPVLRKFFLHWWNYMLDMVSFVWLVFMLLILDHESDHLA